jgi:myo-inositol-1(or 4)-monophosphatase
LIFDFKFSAISLALYLDGRPTLGFIYNPYLDEMFIGQVDVGAWLNGQPISVSQTTDMKQALFGFGTNPYDRSASAQTFAMISDVFAASIEIRRSGSAALDLAYVACGRLDGFFEQTLQPRDYYSRSSRWNSPRLAGTENARSVASARHNRCQWSVVC